MSFVLKSSGNETRILGDSQLFLWCWKHLSGRWTLGPLSAVSLFWGAFLRPRRFWSPALHVAVSLFLSHLTFPAQALTQPARIRWNARRPGSQGSGWSSGSAPGQAQSFTTSGLYFPHCCMSGLHQAEMASYSARRRKILRPLPDLPGKERLINTACQ